MKSKLLFRIIGMALILSGASSCARFHPRPVEPARTMEDFEARRLASPELGDFLLKSGEVKDWPPAVWDLKSLTLAALYYHPDMDIARAEWGTARAGRIAAGERPNPTLNPAIGYNTTTPVSEVTPWIPEVSLEIPIETAGKRGLRIAEARYLSDAARWNILKTAWEVRSRLRGAMLESYAAHERRSLLAERQRFQEEVVRLLQAQKGAGEVSAYEVAQARVELDNSRLAVIDAARAEEEAMARMAAAIGVPRRALDGVDISYDDLHLPAPDFQADQVRRHALLNRSDILSALSGYAASESALHLEIARQYPDISLGPNYQLDQTDSKWTIGLALELPILNRNRGAIAEAEARRAESAARFLSLQSQVIGELDAAIQNCRSALRRSRAADDLLANLDRQASVAKTRHELGEISTLELVGVELELNAAAMARLEILVESQEAVGRLENAAQSPLEVKDWIYTKGQKPVP